MIVNEVLPAQNHLGVPMHSCPTCGFAFRREDLVSQIGDLETWRCSKCEKETWATVSRLLPPGARDETRVRAFVQWAGGFPTPQELIALRAVVPAFRDRGIADVREAVKGLASWELGVF